MMNQTTIKIEITNFDDVPEGHNYVATILNKEYRGVTVSSGSISGCLYELAISLSVLEEFRKTNPAYQNSKIKWI